MKTKHKLADPGGRSD